MDDIKSVLKALEKKGSAATKKTLQRHGAGDNIYGVKVADLKVIAKKIKGEQELALELYDTGNGDAMYLAGLVADGRQMTKKQLEAWAKQAEWHMISGYTVPWVATESQHARSLAMKWIGSKKENLGTSGWATYAGLVTVSPDDELDLDEVRSLLEKVEADIGKVPNRVRYMMNAFVIAVGSYVKPLSKAAKATAKRLGKVEVDMGDTACKVPLALEYIEKIEKRGSAFKKRKTIRC